MSKIARHWHWEKEAQFLAGFFQFNWHLTCSLELECGATVVSSPVTGYTGSLTLKSIEHTGDWDIIHAMKEIMM